MKITGTKHIPSGEYLSYTALEIKSIPDITITNSVSEQELQSENALRLAQVMLSSGLHDPAFGVIPVVAAQKCTTTYEYYHTNDNRPLFVSNIVVMSSQQYSSNVVASVRAMLGGKKQVATKVIPLERFSPQSIKQNYISLPWHISDYLLNHTRSFGTTFARLPFIVTAEEAVALFSTPVGGNKINAGFSIEYASKQGKEYRSQLVDSDNITVGGCLLPFKCVIPFMVYLPDFK